MVRILLVLLLLLTLGCRTAPDAPISPADTTAAEIDAAVVLALQTAGGGGPSPAPGPVSEDCENCNGTGKTGDGRIVMTCRVCNGTGKKPSKSEEAAPQTDAVSEITSDVDVAKLLEDAVKSEPLPESCPMPAPVDYDRIVAAVQAKLAENATQPPDVVELVKSQLREELSVSWGKMSNTMRELLARVDKLEADYADSKPPATDTPLPPAPMSKDIPKDPVVITVYAEYNSAEHVYARDVLAKEIPKHWQISYAYVKTGTPYQAIYQRRVLRFQSRPTVADILSAISK